MGKRSSHDPKLFEGTADYYTYRPAYPQDLFQHTAEAFHLNGNGRALDLGCGIGSLAISFASYFEKVVGMDPDRGMLETARQQAEASAVDNVEFKHGSSWDLSTDMGLFRLVTMGESFHWMDRDEVLRQLHDMIATGGGLLIAWKRIHGPEGYQETVREVIKEFLGEKRRAGQGHYEHPNELHETVMRRSSFKLLEPWQHEYITNWSINDVIGFLYSTSYANKRLLGNRTDDFEKELRQRLQEIAPSGTLTFRITTGALLGKKN